MIFFSDSDTESKQQHRKNARGHTPFSYPTTHLHPIRRSTKLEKTTTELTQSCSE